MVEDATYYLRRTLELAQQGEYFCHPNPMVGCVIERDGIILGEGWHKAAGLPHAEVNALNDARQRGNDVRGANVYVSLEPCCNHGRTPPCTDALIRAEVGSVTCITLDPNPKVAGQGMRLLKEAGIKTAITADTELYDRAQWLNRGFFSRMARKRPWVMLKSAATLDGKTADYQGKSQWITDEQSRHDVQLLRAGSSAVLTGSGTQLADNPSLNVRLPDCQRQPLRVLLDSQLQIRPDAKLIGDDSQLVIITCNADEDRIAALKPHVADIIVVNSPIDLPQVLDILTGLEVNLLMVEAGATLAGAFMQAGLVDELVYYLAPSVLGSKARDAFDCAEPISLDSRKQFTLRNAQQLANDIKLTLINQSSLQYLLDTPTQDEGA